ncbi:hypothetical protein [Tabrizicola sp. M-4]|uniref:hypothetical protein n=1 Tax=Tabrizicola sp. M-4 TaxID=3055847 RepID=UPI003DA7D934
MTYLVEVTAVQSAVREYLVHESSEIAQHVEQIIAAVPPARADLCADPALLAEAVEVLRMVDAWGHGLRHHTSHESKMVKSARAFLSKLENRHDR